MKYIKVIDKSEAAVECIFYMEINNSRFELRKVELCNGALLGFANADISFNGTKLPEAQLLAEAEINDIVGMTAIEIEKADFEDIWQQAVSAANN